MSNLKKEKSERKKNEEYLLSDSLIKKLRGSFNDRIFIPGAVFEDFYQDYVLHILEGRGVHQTVSQFTIDWARKVSGCQRKKRCDVLDILNPRKNEKVDELSFHDLIRECLKKINTGRHRKIFLLIYFYNFPLAKIAEMENVSRARIVQIQIQILLKLRNRIKPGGAL